MKTSSYSSCETLGKIFTFLSLPFLLENGDKNSSLLTRILCG